MNSYRMPFGSMPRGLKTEWFPKYRQLFRELAPGLAWQCEKEAGRPIDQVIADGGDVTVNFLGEVPVSLHLALASMRDVQVIKR